MGSTDQTKLSLGTSMNPTSRQIHHLDLVHGFKEFNRKRRANANYYKLQCKDLTFDEYLAHININYEDYVSQEISQEEIMMRSAKYHNHVKVTKK